MRLRERKRAEAVASPPDDGDGAEEKEAEAGVTRGDTRTGKRGRKRVSSRKQV